MQGIWAQDFKCVCSFDTEKLFIATLHWGASGQHCMFLGEWIPFRLNAGWWFFCDFPTKPQLCSQTGCSTYLRSRSPPCLVQFRFQPETEKNAVRWLTVACLNWMFDCIRKSKPEWQCQLPLWFYFSSHWLGLMAKTSLAGEEVRWWGSWQFWAEFLINLLCN